MTVRIIGLQKWHHIGVKRTVRKEEDYMKNIFGWYLGVSMMEAIGVFMFLCGIFHITVGEIGKAASVGYVFGMTGIFFGIFLLMQLNRKRNV